LSEFRRINNSGFDTLQSGINDVQREVIELQVINRSGFRDIETDIERLVGINHSGFDIKIRQEASGFGNTWSGLREIETTVNTIEVINRSGLNDIETEVQQLQQINRSGFNKCKSGVEGYFAISGVGLSGTVMPSGANTDIVATLNLGDKAFYWYSTDSSGTMTVQVGDPLNNFFDYDTVAFTSGTLTSYIMTGRIGRVRLQNEANMSGTIRAWYVMGCE